MVYTFHHGKIEVAINKNIKLLETKDVLANHKIYSSIKDIDDMRTFMESHVWAVWDFMTLLKRLQADFTTVGKNIVWTPKKSADMARFIGDICLSEESDEFGNTHISHFELYLMAMEDIGANTEQIKKFVNYIDNGGNVFEALDRFAPSQVVKEFVLQSLTISFVCDTHHVSAYFFFGREDPIPEMFSKFLSSLPDSSSLKHFKYYLERHIEVDGSDHGPKSLRLLNYITNDDDQRVNEVITVGMQAINARIALWDDIYERLQ